MIGRREIRLGQEGGFTRIGRMVGILIMRILAAIAIPSFLNQKGKASDASAKQLARTAQTAAMTISTEHDGSFASIKEPAQIHEVETTIPIAEGSNAWLSAANGSENSFEVTTTAT